MPQFTRIDEFPFKQGPDGACSKSEFSAYMAFKKHQQGPCSKKQHKKGPPKPKRKKVKPKSRSSYAQNEKYDRWSPRSTRFPVGCQTAQAKTKGRQLPRLELYIPKIMQQGPNGKNRKYVYFNAEIPLCRIFS